MLLPSFLFLFLSFWSPVPSNLLKKTTTINNRDHGADEDPGTDLLEVVERGDLHNKPWNVAGIGMLPGDDRGRGWGVCVPWL